MRFFYFLDSLHFDRNLGCEPSTSPLPPPPPPPPPPFNIINQTEPLSMQRDFIYKRNTCIYECCMPLIYKCTYDIPINYSIFKRTLIYPNQIMSFPLIVQSKTLVCWFYLNLPPTIEYISK